MRFYYADKHLNHDAGKINIASISRKSRDRPERGNKLHNAVEGLGFVQKTVRPQSSEILLGVHSIRYITFLRTLWQRWMDEVVPEHGAPESGIVANTFPTMRHSGKYPSSVIGQVGYHFHDQVAPVREDTFDIALYAASTAWCAATDVVEGERECYALCRPSGHHAGRENCGGSTYLNNAAVAAQRLRSRYNRVLVIDIDVHHGNGTQDIFYERDDVYFISLHRDPSDFVPYYWGYACERGEGRGVGTNLNLPLSQHTNDEDFLRALDQSLGYVEDFSPNALVISAGYDTYEHDPCKGFKLTLDGFSRIGARLAEIGLPTVIVQEGGYAVEDQGQCVASFLSGFQEQRG